MATWPDLLQHLSDGGIDLNVESENAISILFQFQDGRRQKIVAEVISGSRDWCRITTRLGPLTQQAALEVLRAATPMLPGGLLVLGADYYLGQTLELETLTGAMLEFYLHEVSGRADFLEKTLFQQDSN